MMFDKRRGGRASRGRNAPAVVGPYDVGIQFSRDRGEDERKGRKASGLPRRKAPRGDLSYKGYSWRRATIGSTRMARQAGITQASKATVVRRIATAEYVSGSVERTP